MCIKEEKVLLDKKNLRSCFPEEWLTIVYNEKQNKNLDLLSQCKLFL